MAEHEQEQPPEDPGSDLGLWLWRLKHHESRIYVRSKNLDGKWDAVPLSSLPPKQWAQAVARWLMDGVNPCRVCAPGEQYNAPASNPDEATAKGE